MVMTTNVFWPDDLPLDKQDVLYGWKLAPNWFVVAFGMPIRAVREMSLVQALQSWLMLSNLQANDELGPQQRGAVLDKGPPLIELEDMRKASSSPYQYILYKCPNIDRLRFFATQPLDLDTGTAAAQTGIQHLLSNRLSQLYEAYQPAIGEAVTSTTAAGYLDTTLSLINETYRVRKQSFINIEKGSVVRTDTGSNVASVFKRQAHSSLRKVIRPFTRLFDLTCWTYESLSMVCAAYSIRIPGFSALGEFMQKSDSLIPEFLNMPASRKARQAHLRATQIITLPAEWRSSRARNLSLEEKSRRYIKYVMSRIWCLGRMAHEHCPCSFYNTVWLIAVSYSSTFIVLASLISVSFQNDLIVGWTISSILREHTAHIERLVNATLRVSRYPTCLRLLSV